MKALVKIYKFRQEGSNQRFQVSIPGSYNDGKRWFRRFATKSEAQEFVDEFSRDPFGTVARLKNVNVGTEAAPLGRTDKQAAEYFFGYMQKRLGSLVEGIKAIDYYYDAFHAIKQISVADAVLEYYEYRNRLAIKEEVRANDKSRLRPFVTQFGSVPLNSITTFDLRKFFSDIPLGLDGKASNRITYRKKIGPFFTWAHEEAKYLKENPMTQIKQSDLGEMGVNKAYYQVEQFARMLRIAQGVEPVTEGGETTTEFRDTLFPWFIVSGFAGLRSCEAMRDTLSSDALRWSDIHFDAETPHIHIRGEVAKGEKENCERHIDASWAIDAVREWLALVQPKSEFVCATLTQIERAKARFTRLTGIEFHPNGLRNCFGTYGRAVCGSTNLLSEQMGNTPQIARQHYATSLPAGRGTAFFGLRPLSVIEQAA